MDNNVILIILNVLGLLMLYVVTVRGGILYAVVCFACFTISAGLIATEYPLIILVYIALMVIDVLEMFKHIQRGE